MKGQDTCELFFDDVRVPAANLLGTEEGQGFIQLMKQLPAGAPDRRASAASPRWRCASTITLEYVHDAHGVRQADLRIPEHQVQAGRGRHRGPRGPRPSSTSASSCTSRASSTSRPPRWRSTGAPSGPAGRRQVPAAARRLRLHGGVSDRPRLGRPAGPADLRRHERDHEGDHRAVTAEAELIWLRSRGAAVVAERLDARAGPLPATRASRRWGEERFHGAN